MPDIAPGGLYCTYQSISISGSCRTVYEGYQLAHSLLGVIKVTNQWPMLTLMDRDVSISGRSISSYTTSIVAVGAQMLAALNPFMPR